MPKKDTKKKKKKKAPSLTSEELFLEQIRQDVEKQLRVQIWNVQDAERKKAKKKKMTKKEKEFQAQQRAEQLKVACEQERIHRLEVMKRREEEERKAAIEKEIRDQMEQVLRVEQLGNSCKAIRKLRLRFYKQEKSDLDEAKWYEFLKCDGKPDPSDSGQMNTYLYLWKECKDVITVEVCSARTTEVLYLLDLLDHFLDSPAITPRQRSTWHSVRHSFRELQKHNVDGCVYRLLRDIENNLQRVDNANSVFNHKEENYTICLWVLIQLPIPIPNPKRHKRPRQILDFPDLDMHIVFPDALNFWALCVRAMYVPYDHYSYLCHTFPDPIAPEVYRLDLNTATQYEWTQKVAYKMKPDSQEVVVAPPAPAKPAAVPARGSKDEEELEEEEEEEEEEEIDLLNRKLRTDASNVYVLQEDEVYAELREKQVTVVPDNEVNLRRYWIIGGVYNLDLYEQPPQPCELVLHQAVVAAVPVPKWLYISPFYVEYNPPPAPEPGVTRKPEEIEADLKQQEQEYDKLIYITLSLPSTVMWLDVPIVCQWNSERNIWTTEDIHDVKHNEEKQTVAFRTGRFGAFAMAMYKYSSMPYQAWEIKPAADGKILFTLMAAVLIIEFTLKNNLVCVSQIQNAPSIALDSIIGKYYKLPKLKRILQDGGVNVFPAADVFCYTEGVCEKHWPMEQHTYYNMAQCCMFYNLAWSRWNLLAGRRNIVMQIREWPNVDQRTKPPNYVMLMVTPLKALLIDCTEVSQTFCDEGLPKMAGKFFPDMNHLIASTSSIMTRRKLNTAQPDLVNNVANILCATRIASLS